MAVSFDAIGFILGLGYVMGLRSSMILCAGGVLSNLVLVPVIWFIGSHLDSAVYPASIPISHMTAVQIYRSYVRFIGVGAIATAGIFGIVKSLRVVAGSFGIALRTFRKSEIAAPERTDRDMSMIGDFPRSTGERDQRRTVPGPPLRRMDRRLHRTGHDLVFSFFFTSVAANAIATTARNPVSGMTMLTIIISSVVLLQFGLSGTTGMFFVMAIAGMVCTRPVRLGPGHHRLEGRLLAGLNSRRSGEGEVCGSDCRCCRVGTDHRDAGARLSSSARLLPGDLRPVLASPQASIMKALVEGFMSHQPVAYLLFGVGAMIALIMEMLGQPSLIFALGMYLPLELNTPASGRRIPLASTQQTLAESRGRAGQQNPRTRRHHRLRTDGGRRVGRRLWRCLAAASPGIGKT